MLVKLRAKGALPTVRGTLRTYVGILLRTMTWKVALALALMVCVGLTESIGLLLLVPILQLVGIDVGHGTMGNIASYISAIFTTLGVSLTLASVLVAYVVIVSLHGLLRRWQTTVNLSLQYNFVALLQQRLHRAITYSTWLSFSKSRSSDFTHALTTELERVGAATHQLMILFATALLAAIYTAFALKLSPPMTGLVLAGGGALTLLFSTKARVTYQIGEELSRARKSLYAAITEHFGGMKVAKIYGAEGRHSSAFTTLTEHTRYMNIRAGRRFAGMKLWFEISSVLFLSVSLYVSFEVLGLTTAEVLLLLFLYGRIMPKFSTMQQGYQNFMNLLPSFASAAEMLGRYESAVESKSQTSEKFELHSTIHLDGVSFSYENSPVIRNLDLTIRVGETTAIVGSSGAGKSTLGDLIAGLITPTEGQVLVDGVPLSYERLAAWRKGIGYVTQDTFLFHDTIRSNLLWACPDATEQEILQALRLAVAEEFVSKFPDGTDTVVGDRGVLLSGGERQRLALARALLRKPSMLILDEATNAVDPVNENRIQHAIEGLRGHMTILVISHRLSAIRGADVIHVLEDGHLIESGTWDRLASVKDGRFRELCRAQVIDTETKMPSSIGTADNG